MHPTNDMPRIALRAGAFVAIVFAAFCLWWPWAFFAAILGAVVWSPYYELLAVGLLLDALNATASVGPFGFHYAFSIAALVAFFAAAEAKKRLRY